MVLSDCVRSVSWNPVKINLAIVGLFNGKAVIIDIDKYTVQQELSVGNGVRILSILWHPNFEYIFATGGSDGSVKVWDIKNVSILMLIVAREWAQELDIPQSRDEKFGLEL